MKSYRQHPCVSSIVLVGLLMAIVVYWDFFGQKKKWTPINSSKTWISWLFAKQVCCRVATFSENQILRLQTIHQINIHEEGPYQHIALRIETTAEDIICVALHTSQALSCCSIPKSKSEVIACCRYVTPTSWPSSIIHTLHFVKTDYIHDITYYSLIRADEAWIAHGRKNVGQKTGIAGCPIWKCSSCCTII